VTEIKQVSPEETVELMKEGHVYVDVRTVPEYEAGHVPGSLNVPLHLPGPGGMVPNPEFLEVMQSSFGKDERLVMGCRSGQRSMRAGQMLVGAGFSSIVNLATGFDGSRDSFGRATPGWSKVGLPVENGNPAGQRYEDVKQRKPAG
jgi:rhodanese-related sulfurtransferase